MGWVYQLLSYLQEAAYAKTDVYLGSPQFFHAEMTFLAEEFNQCHSRVFLQAFHEQVLMPTWVLHTMPFCLVFRTLTWAAR